MFTRATVVRLSVVALAAQVWLSLPLWCSALGRTFPLLPIGGDAHLTADVRHDVVALGVGVVLVALLIWPHRRGLLTAASLGLGILLALDANRCQPWTYFYLLVWAAVLAEREEPAPVLRWLIAGVYAWSGLNKLTPYFAEENFPWFCEAFRWMRPLANYPIAGYATAAGEALLAFGLLWPCSRRYFQWIAIAFHLFIMLALSPLGLGWNAVVIPWNAAMAGMVWCVFAPKNNEATRFFPKKITPATAAVLVLVWLMPAGNGWRIWPEALSWKMYSNTQPEAGLYVAEEESLCPALRSVWEKHAWGDGAPRRLLFDDWAMSDLGVPMFNSPKAHRALAKYLCPCTNHPAQAGLWRMEVNPWRRDTERWEEIPCSALR